MSAEFGIYGGMIINSATPRAIKGFTVKDGKFTQVFTDEYVFKKYAERQGIQTFDIGNQIIIPGGADGHTLGMLVARLRSLPSLAGCTQLQCEDKIRKTKLNGGWIQLQQWDNTQVSLSRGKLDSLIKDQPVIVMNRSLHGAVLNTAGMQKALKEGLQNFADDIDTTSGIIKAKAFEWFLLTYLPDTSLLMANLAAYDTELVSKGIVMAHDLLVQNEKQLNIYKQLAKGNQLKCRWRLYVTSIDLLDKQKDMAEVGIPIMGLKAFVDGAYGMQTAWQDPKHAYPDGSTGKQLMTARDIFDTAKKTAEKGATHLALHCIGYAACNEAIEAMELIRNSIYTQDMRVRIEHFQTANERLIREAEKYDVYLCMQPNFSEDVQTYGDIMPIKEDVNPLKKAATLNRDKFFMGSDSMGDGGVIGLTYDALFPPMPHQKAGEQFADVVPFISRNVARITPEDRKLTGGIANGLQADFVLLSHYPRTEEDFETLSVVQTWKDGQVVYDAEEAAKEAASSA